MPRAEESAMTPVVALSAAMFYCMLAKTRTRPGELSALMHRLADELPAIGDSPADAYATIGRALAYVERTPIAVFAHEAAAVLDERQRLCVVLNMLDQTVADGQVDPREREFLREVHQAFGLSDERIQPYFDAIVLKNIRTAFAGRAPLRVAA